MSEEEVRVRKQWLTLQITSIIFGCIGMFLPTVNTLPAEVPASTMNLIKMFALAVSFGFQYILYHCAYKKRGSKLLTVVLVLTVFGVVSTVAFYTFGNIRLSTWQYLLTALQLTLSTAWFFTGLKLRAFNKNYRTNSLSSFNK